MTKSVTTSSRRASKPASIPATPVVAEPVTPAAETATPVSVVTPKAVTKADLARAYFDSVYGTSPLPRRRDILVGVQAAANLSPAAAATYHQNYRKAHGLIQAKKSEPSA